MKKLLFIVLSGMMLIAFTQCGGKGSKEYQDGLKIYEQMEKSINAAKTCDDLDQAVYDMIEMALAHEQEYTEEEKATEEEEAELNKIGDNLRNLLQEKSEKLGCEK